MTIMDQINEMTKELDGNPSGGSIEDCLKAYHEAKEAAENKDEGEQH